MKPLLYKYICSKCKTSFKAPGISGELYGGFLMWSGTNGEVAYLNACEDFVFKEVENLFDEVIKKKSIGNLDDSDIFQSIFSVSCDASEDGTEYRIGVMPICPDCGSREMESWEPVKPSEYARSDIKIITHNKWSNYTGTEKRDLVDHAISNYLAVKK